LFHKLMLWLTSYCCSYFFNFKSHKRCSK